MKGVTDKTWHHEQASTMMLDHLIESNHIDIEREAQQFLHQLINSDLARPKDARMFLFDIVANGRNSIDVDKFGMASRMETS